MTTSPPQIAGKTVRDPRLDFFRGIAMFIIFIAHTPRDFWALWIPARFGFSDATETFVFCSGMASAIAFGSVFDKRGWLMGAARIAHRVWQVYWAHIGLFFTVLLLVTLFDKAGDPLLPLGRDNFSYVNSLNLGHFYTKTADLIVGMFTLTYVPNYFDILPMYLVILAMIPLIMAVSRLSPWAVFAVVSAIWLLANLDVFHFPAEPWSSRAWFFNPLGWQLVFFTGFAFMRGWIKPPPVNAKLIWLAIAIIVISLPFAYFRIHGARPDWLFYSAEWTPWFKEQRGLMKPLIDKSDFGLFRYIHFLATAYLAWVAVGPMGSRIKNWGPLQFVVNTIRKVGQQSLAVFISSLVIAQFIGMVFRVLGSSWHVVLIGNLAGFAALIAVAHLASWFKSNPWRKPATQTPNSSGANASPPVNNSLATPAE